jgi:REP element-mobilizing transposase RayT
MPLRPYSVEELHFAYCYHAFLRWFTYRRRPYAPLTRLDRTILQTLTAPLGMHILEVATAPTEARVLVSLKPTQSVATSAGKLKGRTSRWLRTELGLPRARALLSKGYFACSSGKSTDAQVQAYLEQQGQHHGYADRKLPPLYVDEPGVDAEVEDQLRARHAWCLLQLHIVLATWQRRGLFSPREAEAVTGCWKESERGERFALLKVSFVPDHVHLAIRIHPATEPARLIALLMNRSQEVIGNQFAAAARTAGLARVWQPSAYVGSYGNLASGQVQKYIRAWLGEEET